MEKISVIVNCHNGQKYLHNCISSILNQKYSNFEIIFFDNSSSDNSKTIINNFRDKRIKYYYSPKKLPLYKARNKAVKLAKGEIISFLDVDDWWDEKYLSSRKKFFSDKYYDFFYTNVYLFYEKNKKKKIYINYKLVSGRIYNFLAKNYCIIISGLMIRKKIFKKEGYFNNKFNIIGDFDFTMRISQKYNGHASNKPLAFYRLHNENFSRLNTGIFYKEFSIWFERQMKIQNSIFLKNQKYFKSKLLSLEINYLLLNKKKNFFLLRKILTCSSLIKKIKYLIAFFIPKKIINFLR